MGKMSRTKFFAEAKAFERSCDEKKDVSLHIHGIVRILGVILQYLIDKD